ncbi:MAG TPA: hypothetical protein VGB22_00750 [candidate division Zixibacteria bacterium]|jgi:3-oxoacyl-[acyl-carrier-protein] synthase-1
MKPAVLATGMVTAIGLDAPSSCAAIRSGITGHTETRFLYDGDFIVGCPVPWAEPVRGVERLRQMTVSSIRECADGFARLDPKKTALLICLAEADRPGRFDGLDATFADSVHAALGWPRHPDSAVINDGRVGGVRALERARALVASRRATHCIVAGADTMLAADTLTAASAAHRLQTVENSDGFIPGEAAAAVLIGIPADKTCHLECRGVGYGEERATRDSGEPLRGEGMVAALRAALADSSVALNSLDYRITDLSGTQYGFKEATLALDRLLRDRKEEFDLWHPAECIGEVGAAFIPCALGVALTAARKGYAPGPGLLCHCAADGPGRAAVVLYRTDREPR